MNLSSFLHLARLLTRTLVIGMALLVSAATNAAPAAPAARDTTGATAGIVITGDQEAPLVLFVLPWEDSAVSLPPPAPMSDLIPDAVDHDRTLLQEYDASRKPLGAER